MPTHVPQVYLQDHRHEHRHAASPQGCVSRVLSESLSIARTKSRRRRVQPKIDGDGQRVAGCDSRPPLSCGRTEVTSTLLLA